MSVGLTALPALAHVGVSSPNATQGGFGGIGLLAGPAALTGRRRRSAAEDTRESVPV